MKVLTAFLFLAAFLIINIDAYGKPDWVNQIPNGSKNKCLTCHNSQNGGSTNPFGKTVKNGYVDSKGKVVWGANLASIDSDADGFSNGIELQDEQGAWKIGTTNPGETAKVTNPGDKNSFPTTSFVYNADEIPWFADIAKFEIFPNPVLSNSTISIDMKENAFLSLEVYDINGKHEGTLFNGFTSAGNLELNINPAKLNLSSGIYFVYAVTGNTSVITKLNVTR
jgi:hypothetical protein